MPVNRKLMESLKKHYGKVQARDIYYAMENKAKPKRKHHEPRA